MAVFPMFLKIDGKTFLVVGDGEIARRKKRLIEEFTENILVIPDRDELEKGMDGQEGQDSAPPASPGKDPSGSKNWFKPSDLDNIDYCIAATDDRERNRRIAALCAERGIPVNVPDDPDLCTFYLPAVVKRGDLTIAISTDGKSPALAAQLRREIESRLPVQTEEILDRMGELRDLVPQYLDSGRDRRAVYREILKELLSGDLEPVRETVEARALKMILDPDPGRRETGQEQSQEQEE